jgi:hypothetical protein
MRKTNYLPHLTAVMLALALSSCASTTIVKTWRDPEFHAHPKKILVLALSRSPTVKILSENEFVEQLEKRGLVAVASHGLLTDDIVIHREALRVLVRDQNFDTVLITRPIARKVEETFRPGEEYITIGEFDSDMYGDYGLISGYVHEPGNYEEDVVSMPCSRSAVVNQPAVPRHDGILPSDPARTLESTDKRLTILNC